MLQSRGRDLADVCFTAPGLWVALFAVRHRTEDLQIARIMARIIHGEYVQRESLMNALHRMVALCAITTLASISGCYVARDRGPYEPGPYRYENGDRIDRDGHRDAHWCDNHDDEGCRR
jgi:hypothetical protein